MTRSLTVAIALACMVMGLLLLPASSQTAKTKKGKGAAPAKSPGDISPIMQILQQNVDTKPMREKIRLRDALVWLGEQTKGKLPIIIADEAFTEAFQAGAPFLSDINVNLTEVPATMDVGTTLRLLLAQVGNGQATYLIRQGRIEIVPLREATSARLLGRSLVASFNERPLKEVLRDLSNQTGMTINVDAVAKDKASTPITAAFRNSTLEDALVAVTEMAELKFVVLYNSVYVTIPSKVEALENEERKRDEKREERRDLMKLPGPAG